MSPFTCALDDRDQFRREFQSRQPDVVRVRMMSVDHSLVTKAVFMSHVSGPGGGRTLTPRGEGDFKSPASAIPPPALHIAAVDCRALRQDGQIHRQRHSLGPTPARLANLER
jgi:hypothetical protein